MYVTVGIRWGGSCDESRVIPGGLIPLQQNDHFFIAFLHVVPWGSFTVWAIDIIMSTHVLVVFDIITSGNLIPLLPSGPHIWQGWRADV